MTPFSDQNEPARIRDSIRARLPRAEGNGYPVDNSPIFGAPPKQPVSKLAEPGSWGCFPTLWTIASVLSLLVNAILIGALVLALVMLGGAGRIPPQIRDEASLLLRGLYDNFVKMDRANIRTTIHVEQDIPVKFSLDVSGPTSVRLSRATEIRGARVWVSTGGLTIRDAQATIILPQGTLLPINIESLVVDVDKKVLAVLDVPVNIPLSETELHEPFVGLQEVVAPWLCLVAPSSCPPGVTPALPFLPRLGP